MEENKELKDEEILEKAETVEETETVGETAESTENEEVEEEISENTGSDDLSMIRNLKEENKKLSNELETLKDRLLR